MVDWVKLVMGVKYKLIVCVIGGGKLCLIIYDKLVGKVVIDFGYLVNG